MCRATLLPEPDSPLRMMMRTACRRYPARVTGASTPRSVLDIRGQDARLRPPGGGSPLGRRRRRPRNEIGVSDAKGAAGLRGVMIGELFLVFLDAPIELVGHQVDGRIHVLFRGICVNRAAADVQRRFGLLSQFLHRQHTVNVDDLIEVASDALELPLHVDAQGRGDLHVMAGDVELHTRLLLVWGVSAYIAFDPARRRSFEGAMPIASRYFATVRRATGMPSPDSSSAMRPSLNGLSLSSSLTSLRILARMAVEEVPDPSAPSTWLEKKYSSSKTPRGVCMYLPEVTREMVDSCMPTASAMSFRIIGRMCSSPCSRNAVCRSTMERATLMRVSWRISRLFSSQRASCSCARIVAWLALRPMRLA